MFYYTFFFNDTATNEIYTYWHTLSLHDALPIAGLSILKVTGTRTRPATGLPSLSAGWNVHFCTAPSVTWSNTPAGSYFSTRASETLPSAATSTITTTLPVVLAATASAGYFGGAVILDWISTCAGTSARGVSGRACGRGAACAARAASATTRSAGREIGRAHV